MPRVLAPTKYRIAKCTKYTLNVNLPNTLHNEFPSSASIFYPFPIITGKQNRANPITNIVDLVALNIESIESP